MLQILTTAVSFYLLWSSDNGNLAEAIGPGREFDEMGEMQQFSVKPQPRYVFKEEALVCHEYMCYGENCLYGNLTAGGAGFRNCTTFGGCYIDKDDTEYGIGITARCGPVCEEELNTTAITQGTNTGVTQNTQDTVEPWGNGPTPTGDPFPRKRRRRAASLPSSVCCSENLCNHDSPCGKFPCEFNELNTLECYNVQCTGEDCLYDAIMNAGSAVTTCIAEANSGCYIQKEQTANGVSVTAGCSQFCGTLTSPPPTEATTTEPTTPGSIIQPRRRRSTSPDIQCCSTVRCNHDSPCGTLDCGTQGPPLVCYDMHCEGEGCLPASIIEAGSTATTCTATSDQVCFVKEQHSSEGIFFTAGCSLDCGATTATNPPSTSTAGGEPTTTAYIPRLKRRKRSNVDVSEYECCETSYCNHNSPCGSLTCGSDLLAFEKGLIVLILTIFRLLCQT